MSAGDKAGAGAVDPRKKKIRALARGMMAPEVHIEIEDDEEADTKGAAASEAQSTSTADTQHRPEASTPSTPPPPADVVAPPAPVEPEEQKSAVDVDQPRNAQGAQTIVEAPPPAKPPEQKTASAEAPRKKSGGRRRAINMVLTDDETLDPLEALERKIRDNRYTEQIKGQTGATLIFKMGIRLLSRIENDDDLFDLARDCATYK